MNERALVPRDRAEPDPDFEVLSESALARAQSTIQVAIDQAEISRADLARKMDRPRSFVSRMLSGDHNLTIKTMARALLGCGYEVEFDLTPIVWDWSSLDKEPQVLEDSRVPEDTLVPAN